MVFVIFSCSIRLCIPLLPFFVVLEIETKCYIMLFFICLSCPGFDSLLAFLCFLLDDSMGSDFNLFLAVFLFYL